jgi:hypothetical protein
VANGVFYFFTIYNIHKSKKKQQKNKNELRRFSRVKLPGDREAKFYIQMGCIMGFTWIIGFFLTTFSRSSHNLTNKLRFSDIVYLIFTYLFILLNSSTGVFIFFAFLFRKEILAMYVKKLKILKKRHFSNREYCWSSNEIDLNKRSREVSQSSSVNFVQSLSSKLSLSIIFKHSTLSCDSSALSIDSSNQSFDVKKDASNNDYDLKKGYSDKLDEMRQPDEVETVHF